MPPGITGFVNDREKLAASLAAKGGKYKPEEPFVLAVLLMSDGTVDHEDIEAALLGPEFIRLTPTRSNSDARFASRTGSGFEATNRGGPGFPRS